MTYSFASPGLTDPHASFDRVYRIAYFSSSTYIMIYFHLWLIWCIIYLCECIVLWLPTLCMLFRYMMSNPLLWLLMCNGICLDDSLVGTDEFDADVWGLGIIFDSLKIIGYYVLLFILFIWVCNKLWKHHVTSGNYGFIWLCLMCDEFITFLDDLRMVWSLPLRFITYTIFYINHIGVWLYNTRQESSV